MQFYKFPTPICEVLQNLYHLSLFQLAGYKRCVLKWRNRKEERKRKEEKKRRYILGSRAFLIFFIITLAGFFICAVVFFSSPEPKRLAYSSPVELASVRASVCASVRLCVCVFTLSNMNIAETNVSIATKFYLKHHWCGGKASLDFGPDRIRTLVPMATESSNRVIMEKTLSQLFLGCFSSDPFHTCR